MAIKVDILGTLVAPRQEEFVSFEKNKWEKAQYVSSHETAGGNYLVKAKGPHLADALKTVCSPRAESSWRRETLFIWNFTTLREARHVFRSLTQFDKLDIVLMHVLFNA